jgi:predicted amidophosphoribosyltransferase
MAGSAIEQWADRFRRIRFLRSGRTCPLCRAAAESQDWCSACRVASALDRRWRLRRIECADASLAVFSLGRYRGPDGHSPSPAAVALMRFKYTNDRAMGRALMRTIAAADRLPVFSDAVLVPIPLHRRRLRERGFNQAAWLARALARRHGVRLATDALACRADLPRRPGLSRAGRTTTSIDRFTAYRRLSPGAHAVLVDDVCTTGLTLRAAKCALEHAGVGVRAAVVLLSTERTGEGAETAR